MIKLVKGSIFDSPAQALINTVNCEGVMGKGLALQFKTRYSAMYKDYVRACMLGELRPGKLHTFTEKGKLIINFPTKDTWRRKSKMQYIVDGLDALIELIRKEKLQSVAVPPLGAGNGGLNWIDVKKVILEKLSDIALQVDIYIYEPLKNPGKMVCDVPKLGTRAYLLMGIMDEIKASDYTAVVATVYFVNYLMKKKYFYIDRIGKLPKEGIVEDILKNIEIYKKCNGNKPYSVLQGILERQIKCKKFECDVEKLKPYIGDSCAIIKRMNDEKMMMCAVAIMEILRQSRKKGFSEKDLFAALEEKQCVSVCAKVIKVLSECCIIEQSLFGIQLRKQ